MDFKKLDYICERIRDTFDIPSLGAAFYYDGAYHSCCLGCDDNTLFAVGSCTKSFSAGAIMKLQDKGLLSISDKVKEHIKDISLSDSEIENNLTIKDILSHRSGMPGCDLAWYSRHDNFSDADLMKAVSLLPKSDELGRMHQYNNMIYALSGKIVKNCTGLDWKKFVADEILNPLGIRKYAFSPAEALNVGNVAIPYIKSDTGLRKVEHAFTDSISPSGSLYLTPSELLKWNVTLLSKGVFNKHQIISSDAAEHMAEGVIEDENCLPVPKLMDAVKDRMYCLGLQSEKFLNQKLIYHGGAIDGFLASQSILPCRNCASVMLTDLGGTFAREAFMYSVNGLYLGDETDWIDLFADYQKVYDDHIKQILPFDFTITDSNKYADLSGVYFNPLFGNLVIEIDNKKCTAHIGIFDMPVKLSADKLSFFHIEFGLIPCEIVRNSNGKITSLLVCADPAIPHKFCFEKSYKDKDID